MLDLGALAQGSPPGITPAMGQFVAEAASVVMEHNQHSSGVVLPVQAKRSRKKYAVTWPTLHADAKRTYNLPDAAQHGACGIAFLLAQDITPYKIIERSWTRTGIDYWLGQNNPSNPFQKAARLEVSGIVNNPAAVAPRTRSKAKQTAQSANSGLPAFVAIVEFGQPQGVFTKV